MAGGHEGQAAFTPWNSSGEHFFKLEPSSISLGILVLGAYLTTINQLSYFLKEKAYISSALISLCVGILFGPVGADVISPWHWTDYNDDSRNELTFQLTRIVIGIQVMFAGIDLPAAYLKRQWLSLFILLLPIMTIAWFVCAGFILLFIPGLTFVEALCISACVAPTDPILAAAIVKGRFAEKHVPKAVRDVLSAESGANDGLGYPFMFLAIFLMDRRNQTYGNITVGRVIGHWIVATWFYQLLLACAMGAAIGYIARKSLKIAHTRQWIDHESFLAYGIGLSFFTLGAVGSIGSDDVLACFVAGNSLTWRDFYRIEAEDDTFQDVIDNLLNAAIFIYVGSIIPWSEFSQFGLVPWKLVLLSICILLFRRPPWIMATWKFTPAIPDRQQALFAGWFGPIGVSAIYYAQLALKELPSEREQLRNVIVPVVLFIALSSTLIHGITIPLAKFAPKALVRTHSVASSFVRNGKSGKNSSADVRTETIDPSSRNQAHASQGSPESNEKGKRASSEQEEEVVAESRPSHEWRKLTGPFRHIGLAPGGEHMVEILVGDKVRVVPLAQAEEMRREYLRGREHQHDEHGGQIGSGSGSRDLSPVRTHTASTMVETPTTPVRTSHAGASGILRNGTMDEAIPEGAQTPKRAVEFDL